MIHLKITISIMMMGL